MFRTTYDAEKKQWNGVKTTSFALETSLGSEILKILQKNGPRVAQICAKTGKCATFNDLYSLTICAAKSLRNLGCKKGDLIYFFTENNADTTPVVYAALCLGCAVNGENPGYGSVEIRPKLSYLKPRVVICDRECYTLLKECMIDMNITADFFIIDDQTVDARPLNYLLQKTDDDSDFVPAEINITKDVAFLNYTSGSTGNPKTVPLTHANVLDKLRKYSALIEVRDTMLGWAHFRGISGVRFLISGTLSGARRVVNQGAFTPERFFKLVQEFNVNVTFLNDSSRIHQLLKHPQIKTADLSSLKMFHCAGSIVPLHFIEKMNSHLGSGKFCNSFGMTEMCGAVAINLYHSKNNCTGQLIGDCEAKIVNEQGNRLGVNESGELYLKDPFIFEGYLGDDGNASKHFDREGFFRTGDIAHFDENSDLFITDRKKELFKYMGYHIIPNEIQPFLDQIDGVDESCVVPVPISKYVLAPTAVIVKTENSACTEEFIYDAVSNSFADHKRLRGGVYFVNSIPRTATGKVNRRLVAEMALNFYKDKNMVKRNN